MRKDYGYRRRATGLATVGVAAIGLVTLCGGRLAVAATINVTTASGVVATDSSTDGKCDLIEAVKAANTNTAYHGCTAGSSSGTDKIVLTSGSKYLLNKTLLPTSSIELTTSSTGTATISPSGWVSSTLAGHECLIYVNNGNYSVQTKLTGVTLDGLSTIGVAGFCNASSTATLRKTRVKSFQRGGILSWCDTDHGCSGNTSDLGGSTTLNVYLSQIDSNISPGNGGGIAVSGLNANLTVENSAIINNQSEGGGGGVWIGSGPGFPTFRNSTIASNSAFRGGGIYFDGFSSQNVYVQIFDSTVAYNSASDEGGGLYFEQGGGSSRDFIITNSIINDNSSAWGTYPNVNNNSSNAGLTNCAKNSIIYLTPGTPAINVYSGEFCNTNTVSAGLGPLMTMGGNGLPVVSLLKESVAIDPANGQTTAPNNVQQRDSWLSNEVGTVGGPATWQLLQRDVDGNEDGLVIRDVGAVEFDPNWQGELTPVQAVVAGTKAVETSSSYSRGAGMKFAPTSCTSTTSSITYAVQTAESGRFWNIFLGMKSTPTSGIYRVDTAYSPSGPWTTIKTNVNTYTPVTIYSGVQLNANFFYQASGTKYLKFTMTGVGTANGGCNLFVDYIYMMPN